MTLTHFGRVLTPEEEAKIPKFLKRHGRSVARIIDDLRFGGSTVNSTTRLLPKEAKKLVDHIDKQKGITERLKRQVERLQARGG